MIAPEKITLLNPKSVNIDHISGGIPTLTREDVLCALAGVPEGMWRLALVKELEEYGEARKLYYALSVAALGKKSVRNWVKKNKGYLETLCLLAIKEITESRHCRVCHGTAMRLTKSKLVECTFCRGTGHKRFDAETRKELSGIKDWKKCRYVYERIYHILLDWQSGIKRKLKKY